jgi:hypothetical protein
MPNELWADVRADAAATDELVRQLVATAGAVGEVVAVLEVDGPAIVDDWGGPHREAFDADRARLVASGHALAASLLASAREATALLAAAEGEQRLRARLRHQLLAAAACAPGDPC